MVYNTPITCAAIGYNGKCSSFGLKDNGCWMDRRTDGEHTIIHPIIQMYKKSDNVNWHGNFLFYCNQVQFQVNNARSEFYSSKLRENSSQPKKNIIWQILKL